MASLLPLAHAGHWLWVLYIPPLLVVLASIVRTKLLERGPRRDETSSGESKGRADAPSAGGTGEGGRGRTVARPQAPLPRDRTRG